MLTEDPDFHPLKLLTVVCEAELENLVAEDAMRLGARGYTVIDARGCGSHGRRDASWHHSGNVRFEILCDLATGRVIARHLQHRYFADYAMVCYLSEVQVLRQEKF
ncbi:transcriptional regulator [Dechloromonas sp. ZY10]|uniref:P-II family nitrogen regulator n=1 Tax=Dechloromonas aquae TaxID=2664436 RepID=UPI003529B756